MNNKLRVCIGSATSVAPEAALPSNFSYSTVGGRNAGRVAIQHLCGRQSFPSAFIGNPGLMPSNEDSSIHMSICLRLLLVLCGVGIVI